MKLLYFVGRKARTWFLPVISYVMSMLPENSTATTSFVAMIIEPLCQGRH
ncbi:MAG: hypothetical protein AB7O26_07180 [Planctomycetaceae bacterium]